MENEISKSVFKTCSLFLIGFTIFVICYVLSMGPVYWLIANGYFGKGVFSFPYYLYLPVWLLVDCNSPVGWPNELMTPKKFVYWYIYLFI